jgi:hypothetical protein
LTIGLYMHALFDFTFWRCHWCNTFNKINKAHFSKVLSIYLPGWSSSDKLFMLSFEYMFYRHSFHY